MLRRFVDLRAGEAGAVLWSFAYFFTLLCGYYVLRPLREAMGIAGGTDKLQWLFTGTFVVMLAATPFYSWVVARFPRRTIVPIVYRFFVVNLLLFFLLLATGAVERVWVARAFFVWVSVYNLFVVSAFWSVMADLFSREQSKRVYGFIAAGGTAGALAGPTMTALLARHLGETILLLVSALLLEAAVQCVRRLNRIPLPRGADPTAVPPPERVGGTIVEGYRAVARSPYLLGICVQTFLYGAGSTFLYFQQARIVEQAIPDSAGRTELFAWADLGVNVLTLGTQTAVTARVLTGLGVGAGLATVPLVSIAGFLSVAALPTLVTLVGFYALRRVLHFALEKPARETLFTVVTEEEKYKSKGFIDTVVYRGGDALTGWAFAGLRSVGLTLSAMALTAVPLSVVGLGIAVFLARRQEALAARERAAATAGADVPAPTTG